MKAELKIEGMGCSHCIRVVQGVLEQAGVGDIEVELGRAVFSIEGADALQELVSRIDEQGYQVVEAVTR